MSYSATRIFYKYLWYLLTASNGKGHGIHSPFVFEFITQVLNDERNFYCYKTIEKIREKLLIDETKLQIEDFGAGSHVLKTNQRVVKDIAKSSLKPKKYAQLLFRIMNQYYSNFNINIIELGTSFGVTSSYMASANQKAKMYTFEGSKEIANIASKTFHQLEIKNIEIVQGNFQETLEKKLNEISTVDVAFLDANHQKEATLHYFNLCLNKSNEETVLIFDDIHWSKGMEEAWQEIKAHPSVTLTIDLFFIGLVYFRKENKVKQHFNIRF